jgi:hypothetical protein
MNEHTINNTNRQTTKNVVKPLLKPHEQEFMKLVLQIEQTGKIPDRSIAIGDSELDNTLNVLIEGLVEGDEEGYQSTKKALLKTNQRLMRMFSAYAPEVPNQETEDDPRKVILPNGKTAFKTYKYEDLKKLPRVPWLVSGILQKQSVSLFYGDANTGKTFTALDIAMHISHGSDWLGHPIKEPGHVLYIYAEGSSGLQDRIAAWLTHNEKDTVKNIDFVPYPVQLLGEREELCNTIDYVLDAVPDLIVFDTFSMTADGVKENDNTEVARWLKSAAFLKYKYGSHVMVIHHVGKNGDYRGAAAFKGNVDTMICLCAENDDAPITVECKKQRDKAKFEPFTLQLQVVDLGIDEETYEPLSSCVIIAGGAVKDAFKEQADSEQKLMLSILANNPTVGANQWERLCKGAGIPSRSYTRHKTYMVSKGIIKEIAPERKGKAITYKIDPAYIPAQEIAQDGQEGA